jgi:hypothetical protein
MDVDAGCTFVVEIRRVLRRTSVLDPSASSSARRRGAMSGALPRGTPLARRRLHAPRGSLAQRTLLRMAVRLAAVIVTLTAVSYYHVRRVLTRQALDGLMNYIGARQEREQTLFDLARDNHVAIAKELVKRIHDYDGRDPEEEFNRRYVMYPDGAVRTRAEGFDATRQAGVAIHSPARLDVDAKRRVLAAEDTLGRMGQALHTRFQNTWIIMPENLTMGYTPEVPRRIFETRPRRDFTQSELFTSAGPARNPERRSVWSATYWDGSANVAAITVTTPAYD